MMLFRSFLVIVFLFLNTALVSRAPFHNTCYSPGSIDFKAVRETSTGDFIIASGSGRNFPNHDGPAHGEKDIAQIDTYVWKIALNDILDQHHEYVEHVNLIR